MRWLSTDRCDELLRLGTLTQHRKLESTLAQFLGTEDAITFGMGFATNALNIASIVGKVSSDDETHPSLIWHVLRAGMLDSE